MAFTPSLGAVLPDPVLSRIAVQYGTGGDYIADKIAPVARVPYDLFKYAVWGREDTRNDTQTSRAITAKANEVSFAKTYLAGQVEYRGLQSAIGDEDRQNDINGGASLDARRVQVLTAKLRLEVEIKIQALADLGTALAVPGTGITGGIWTTSTNNARATLLAGKEAFRQQAGRYPNTIVMSPACRNALFLNPAYSDFIRYVAGPEFIKTGMFPVVENMQIIAPEAIVDPSNPGTAYATTAVTDVWSAKSAYFMYIDPTPDDSSTMTALRQFRSVATGTEYLVYKWRDPDASARCDHVAVLLNQKEIGVGIAAGGVNPLILRMTGVIA